MLACGHDREPVGMPLCEHLRARPAAGLDYVTWYTGVGSVTELLCNSCADKRQNGRLIATDLICEECFDYATAELGNLAGIRGKPEIRVRSEAFNRELAYTNLPPEFGKVIDISPIVQGDCSIWILLAEGGLLSRFNANTGEGRRLAHTNVPPEPNHAPWCGHVLKRRLYSSPEGGFAAVVNDYGRFGQIIDLRSGQVTLELDGGDYHEETVPFSFAFAQVKGRVVAIHRTAWNRLDVSDPLTGALLTVRNPPGVQAGRSHPEHYLDYFHGALRMSPKGTRIADDGWVWNPVGMPTVWNLEPWMADNVWEAEDGPSRKPLCITEYYWDRPSVWLDENRIAIGGLGEDEAYLVDGARIFDVSLRGSAGLHARADLPWPREVSTFAGPAGAFFSDGQCLFSSNNSGLSRWDFNDGARTGILPGFTPTHHHPGARELATVVDHFLVRWRMGDDVHVLGRSEVESSPP